MGPPWAAIRNPHAARGTIPGVVTDPDLQQQLRRCARQPNQLENLKAASSSLPDRQCGTETRSVAQNQTSSSSGKTSKCSGHQTNGGSEILIWLFNLEFELAEPSQQV
jgi:hypothetical protein